jgi:glycosyltransferase involved in cell wall biosynthesis
VTLAAEQGGACRTLAEAMACGLPVVASNHERHVEIGGRHVLLVEPRPRAVREALLELGRSAAWRHELGLEARRFAAGHLDIDVAVRLLEAAYAHSVALSPHPWSARRALPAS